MAVEYNRGEGIAIARLEQNYMTKEPGLNRLIACEDLDYYWSEEEAKEFRQLWNMGISIDVIAQNFGREVDEVFILALDQARKGLISKRKGALFGRYSV